MKKPFEPNFRTPQADFCKEELNKLNKKAVYAQFHAELRNNVPDLSWEVEQIAKSSGIYLEFDRANKSPEKDWRYMIRISVPGGGPINRAQWKLYDELSEKYTADTDGHTSIRLTTRQNIQFHWIKKDGVVDVVKTLAQADMRSINGCGDNTRNVMGAPLSLFSPIFNAAALAHKLGDYFQLPLEPFIKVFEIDPNQIRQPGESFKYAPNQLNRKFKIAVAGVMRDAKTGKLIPDNSVEILTNDLAISPIIDGEKVERFQLYVGGGQGERNGHPSMAALAKPLCIVNKENLLAVLDAVLQVHQEWGDRQNRVWARVKYVVKKMGIDWYRDQVSAKLGFPLEKPDPNHDIGDRQLYFGWHKQETNNLWAYGAFIENGRITDAGTNGKLKSMVRHVMDHYPIQMMVTPNQDILFINIPEGSKNAFEADLKKFGYGARNGKPYSKLRLRSGACVGRDTCRLTYTDSEKFEPFLIDELEQMGWGDMAESIGITGCERQCFRPATKTIGLVGTGLNRYQFKLFGDETARFQGTPLFSPDKAGMFLRSVPREDVAKVIDSLFKDYQSNKNASESLGAYHRRIGAQAIIDLLKANPATSKLMEKSFPADNVIE